MAGKGSAPRPKEVDDETFSSNWEQTFGHDMRMQRAQEVGQGRASGSNHRDADLGMEEGEGQCHRN